MSFGIWPAVYASVLSFMAYNLFFIEPLYTFTVAKPHELLALIVFLGIAVVISTLAGRIRDQAQMAVGRMRATRRLYEFTRRLSGIAGFDDIPEAAVATIHSSLARPAAVLLEHDGELDLRAAWPPEESLDTAAMTAARWALEHDEPAGADTATLPSVPWFFLPLRTARGSFGVIGLGRDVQGQSLDPEARTLLETLAEQTAAALDRASLAREMVSARSAAETERVRNTLLASISHDFRTPLASILGSATSLLEFGDKLDAKARERAAGSHQVRGGGPRGDGAQSARHDAHRCRRPRSATRLGRPARDRRAGGERRSPQGCGAVDRGPACPTICRLIRADAKLVEQALGNAVGNAIAHTPPETLISSTPKSPDEAIALSVTDDGPGIGPEMLPQIFEKFVHPRRSEAGIADGGEGTGLGLAIAKGIMDAHGGTIAAESPVAQRARHAHHPHVSTRRGQPR